MVCPLCLHSSVQEVLRKEQSHHGEQVFNHCTQCDLIFVPPEGHISAEQEKERYDTHNNDAQDPKYRAFLQQAIDPLLPHLTAEMHGLDFGAGPGPTVSVILEELGYHVANYDPIYAPDEALVQDQYDFIISTETVEHFRNPREEWERLSSLVKDGGYLSIMTQSHPLSDELATWWYLNDPTHIALYSNMTMEWIAKWQDWLYESFSDSVTVFQKKRGA